MSSAQLDIKIDWLSFTVPLPGMTENTSDDTVETMIEFVDLFTEGLLIPVIGRHGWEVVQGGGFYKAVVAQEDTKARLSWGSVNPHVYVEINGVACERIKTCGIFDNLLKLVGSRASRIDVAGDIECDCQPSEMIGNYYSTTRTSKSDIRSSEGQTVYIGSRKSERFLRVYRYRHPHPRSHLLRIEHEQKGAAAKLCIQGILTIGLKATFEQLCNNYHWDDDSWRAADWTEGKFKAARHDTEKANTVLWLLETVAPALVKAHREKLINLDDWLKDNVLPKI
jgi:DNA relaxase NicK